MGQLGSRVAREVERNSRCHSQGHTHQHWALGEPLNDCPSGSTYVLTLCTDSVKAVTGKYVFRTVIYRVLVQQFPHGHKAA